MTTLQTHPPAILRPVDAAHYIGVSRRHIYNLAENDANFPRKIIITSRCVGFRKADLDAWLERKANGEV